MEQEKRTYQAAATQKELLDGYEQATRHWIDRTQSEMTLWANLGSKLATTRSVPEAYEAFGKCVSQQMKMTAEDAQRLLNDYEQMRQKVTQFINKGST